MIPKIIHQTAETKSLSWEERRLRRRMQMLLPGWQYHLWDDKDRRALFKGQFPEHAERFEAIGRSVVRADVARCAFLYAHGGFYFDTDFKLLRPIGDELLELSCVLPISRGTAENRASLRLGTAVLASRPGHPLWRDFVSWTFENPDLEQTQEHAVETTTGPEGFTRFYISNAESYPDVSLRPRHEFHPPIRRRLFYARTGYGAHLCWGSWRSENLPTRMTTVLARKLTAI